MLRKRRLPRDWNLVVGGLYRDREDPKYMVLVRSEPHAPSNPELVATASTDNGAITWFSGLQAWRPIAEHCDLIDTFWAEPPSPTHIAESAAESTSG